MGRPWALTGDELPGRRPRLERVVGIAVEQLVRPVAHQPKVIDDRLEVLDERVLAALPVLAGLR
jgi:hypothetical protein